MLATYALFEGAVWLFLATIAEVPPAVCLRIFLAPLIFRSLLPPVIGVHLLESKRYDFFLLGQVISKC
jgi:hypothetical protein